MSAPQRHLNVLSNPPNPRQLFPMAARKSISDRLGALVGEIEAFLRICTDEEMCDFWEEVHNLRHRLHKSFYSSEVPQFLNGRRQHRDFCRILEVLADLPYPKLHLSDQVNQFSSCTSQPYFATHL